jgi:hypothetical protein
MQRVAREQDAAFAPRGGDALAVDVLYGSARVELKLFGSLPSVGLMKAPMRSLARARQNALFVSGEVGVFNVGDAPLGPGGAVGISVGIFAGVGDDGSVHGVDDEV